jgi:outer membrane protein TolC
MVVAPLHGFDPMHPPDFDRNLLQGAVNLGYTLFDGGARGARILRAEAGAGAARAGGESARMDVMVQTSAAFLGVLTARDVLDAVRAQKTALTAEVERVRQFLNEGKAPRVDLLRVQAALSRVEASEISAHSDLELALGRLSRFTGLPLEDLEGRDLSRVVTRGEEVPGKAAVLTDARAVNPELSRARQILDGAAAGVRGARAAWFPKLEAGGRYADFGTLDGGHVQEWQGTLQLSYPIFVGGARKGAAERARAEERQAAEALRLAELNLEDEAESAVSVVKEAQALRVALEVSVAQNEEVARIEALALEAGAGVQTDFLKAQADLFQARASLAQARHGEVLARIRLARVRGALTPGWIQENMEVVR